MNIQEIAIYIIVVVCVYIAGKWVYRYIKRANRGDNPCATCHSDCALRDIKKNTSCHCGKNNDNKKHSCCG